MRARARWTAPLLVVALCVGSPAASYAHGTLLRSIPAKGAHLAAAPRELRLTFTEAPELTFTRVELIGPDGRPVPLDPSRAVPDSATVIVSRIRGSLVAGAYRVRWQIAGKDGHPVRGDFSFTIAPGATGLGIADSSRLLGEAGAGVTAPGQAPPPAAHHDPVTIPTGGGFDASSPVYIVIRWITFAALLTVVGGVVFYHVVLQLLRRKSAVESALVSDAAERAARIAFWGALALLLAALLRLYAQSYALHGSSRALDPSLIASMLGQTVWGWGWVLQLAGAGLAIIGFQRARRASSSGWNLAAVAALILAFTPALSGHAASAPRFTTLSILADGLHVIGAGGWLGSLLFVLAAGIPAALRLPEGERGRAVADVVNAFSPTALVFAGIIAITGAFAAWVHIGSLNAVWQANYGRILLLKLGILVILAGTGAYNWRRVRPALGNVEGARRIRRSARVELAVAVFVLAVTAVLVAMPTPMDESMTAGAGAQQVAGEIDSVSSPRRGP